MDVRAMVILGGAEASAERIATTPIASLDVLGRPVLLRVLDRLLQAGVASASVVCESGTRAVALPKQVRSLSADDIWSAASRVFREMAAAADVIVVVRLGAYAEIRYGNLLRHHAKQGRPATAVLNRDGDMGDVFVLNASSHKEAAYLFRHQLRTLRHPHSVYVFSGYSNPLRNAADLRRLAIDAFCGNAELVPDGAEVRPGVWISRNATIHNSARVIAPAYIGAHAKVCAAAVVTRCSVLEHHACVGAGTVIDNATLLPRTKVGRSLDVAHAVVGLKRFAHLGRKVEIEISDPRLVGSVSTSPLRLLQRVVALAAYLPAKLRSLTFAGGERERRHTSPVQSPYPALAAKEEFPAPLAGARRYGND